MPNILESWRTRSEGTSFTTGVSDRRREVMETGALQVSAAEETAELRNRDKWEALINTALIELDPNGHAFGDEDEGLIAPTKEAAATAGEFAIHARDCAFPVAGQVLPDGDGGIVFHRALPNGATMSFEAAADGSWAIWFYPRAPRPPVKLESSQP